MLFLRYLGYLERGLVRTSRRRRTDNSGLPLADFVAETFSSKHERLAINHVNWEVILLQNRCQVTQPQRRERRMLMRPSGVGRVDKGYMGFH
jgi:hypothetical protein